MKKILISTFAVSALLLNVSCDTDFDTDVKDVVVTSGEANFSKYVSLGNSLTSGIETELFIWMDKTNLILQ
jgi:hypothetical protein